MIIVGQIISFTIEPFSNSRSSLPRHQLLVIFLALFLVLFLVFFFFDNILFVIIFLALFLVLFLVFFCFVLFLDSQQFYSDG